MLGRYLKIMEVLLWHQTKTEGRAADGCKILFNEEEWILFYARMESAYGLYD